MPMARRNRQTRKAESPPGWLWMLFGLGIGLVIAAGVYFRRAPSPADHAVATGQAAPATPDRAPARRGSPARGATAGNAEGAKASDQRFDFYDILPQYEVVLPEV